MNAKDLPACADRLEGFLSKLLAGVGRSERRHHGSLDVQGLRLDGERKSIEPLAERVLGGNVQALQQFVGQSPWAWEPVRRLLVHQMEVQKELLRHANIQTTLNVYTRAISDEKQKAVSRVAQILYEFVPAGKLKSS